VWIADVRGIELLSGLFSVRVALSSQYLYLGLFTLSPSLAAFVFLQLDLFSLLSSTFG
jgi:hypothetical protein